MLFEFMPKGGLDKLLRNEGPSISEQALLHMAYETASGMAYLHDLKIIHRDLAARNLLVSFSDSKYTVKVSDFGLSKRMETESYISEENKLLPLKVFTKNFFTKLVVDGS